MKASFHVGLSVASRKCGYVPTDVTLKRGERQSLVFWTDQNYDNPPVEQEVVETTTKDYFLEAVNAGMKPVKEELQENELAETTTILQEEEDVEVTEGNYLEEIDQEAMALSNDDIAEVTTMVNESDEDEATEEVTESVEAQELPEATKIEEPSNEANEDEESSEEVTVGVDLEDETTAAPSIEPADEVLDDDDEATEEHVTEVFSPTEAIETVAAQEDDVVKEQEISDEILDDDDYSDDTTAQTFSEDFGTPVIQSEESVYDPQDDIADVTETNDIPENVELIETSDPPPMEAFEETTLLNHDEVLYDDDEVIELTTVLDVERDSEIPTTVAPEEILYYKEFDDTTIAFPIEPSSTPKFEAVVAEVEDDPRRPSTDEYGQFQDTTTDSPNEQEQPANNLLISQSAEIKPPIVVEAIEAEQDYDTRPDYTATDANGNFIETTTGTISPNKVALVAQTVQANSIKELEKTPRGADEDLEESDMLDIQVLKPTESPEELIANITDPSDKPGSILTTLIDGFLLQKQPQEESVIASTTNDKETVDGFPVTNILSGIYNFVSSVIQPTEEPNNVDDVEAFTAIPQSAINVHNMPRDQLIVEAVAGPLPLDAPSELESGDASPLPLLPGEFLRGAPISTKPRPKLPSLKKKQPVLFLNENGKVGTREPVSIPIPDLITGEPRAFDAIESIRNSDRRFKRFIQSQPEQIRQHFRRRRQATEEEDSTTTTQPESDANIINCSWNIKVYLIRLFLA